METWVAVITPWAIATAWWAVWPPFYRRWEARQEDRLGRLFEHYGVGNRPWAEVLLGAAFVAYHLPVVPLVLVLPGSWRARQPVAAGWSLVAAAAVVYSGVAWWAWGGRL